jgi:mono/diheme cytochrome c family protein
MTHLGEIPRAALLTRMERQPGSESGHLTVRQLRMRLRNFRTQDLGPFSWIIVLLGLAMLLFAGRPSANSQTSPTPKSGSNDARIARGKYIVEGVAMCGMCHTPRTDSGQIDTGRTLDGAAVWLLPAHSTGNWPLKAPRIAGTPPASDEDMVRLLMTGIWTDGSHLRLPMPQFRMSREDAESVVAYLRSLRPGPGD